MPLRFLGKVYLQGMLVKANWRSGGGRRARILVWCMVVWSSALPVSTVDVSVDFKPFKPRRKTRLAIVILASWARQMILRKVGWGDGCHGDLERNHGETSWRCWNVTGWGWLSQCRGSSPESVDEIETTDDESSAVFQESSENVTIMLPTMRSVIKHHRNQQEESAEFWDSWQFVSHLPVIPRVFLSTRVFPAEGPKSRSRKRRGKEISTVDW